MQQAIYSPKPFYSSPQAQFGHVDERRKAYEESFISKWHCVKTILCEQYLWDMRCWAKPKHEYSKAEIAVQIIKWVNDHREGNWSFNCGHCVYCMRKLLYKHWATLEEVTNLVIRNNNIQNPNEIGNWNTEIVEKGETAL